MKSLTIAYAGFHLQCGELFAFQACTHLRWTFSSMCSCLLSPSAVFSGDSFTQAAFVVDLVDQVRNFFIESQIEDLQSINQTVMKMMMKMTHWKGMILIIPYICLVQRIHQRRSSKKVMKQQNRLTTDTLQMLIIRRQLQIRI
ncbi:hypothetical protein S245_065376 [Arachis hypogaea]